MRKAELVAPGTAINRGPSALGKLLSGIVRLLSVDAISEDGP